MNTSVPSLHHLSDVQVLQEVQRLATSERRATAALVRALAELDVRRLYLAEGFSSLFGYCTQVLHLSEHAAYGRIEAARAARRYPRVLALLEEGAVTLTTITLVAPHLTTENHSKVLDSTRNKSKRDVERIVAALRPAFTAWQLFARSPCRLLRRAATACRHQEHNDHNQHEAKHHSISAVFALKFFRVQPWCS